ncbi:hypothetical protein ACO9S2_04450 [Nitrospira sp. NS4]|uniref:hypothetical protein n=1 Tax=Nitrospira sp. NS4 TaxID=3414498 RepID=UPI003C2D9102
MKDRGPRPIVFLLLVWLLVGACAAPDPLLRSNKHLQLTGREAAKQDITACEEQAERAGLQSGVNRTGSAAKGGVLGTIIGAGSGASAGLIGGLPGVAIGAVVGGGLGLIMGTAGGAYGPTDPDPAYADEVVRCLIAQGYEVSGWQ